MIDIPNHILLKDERAIALIVHNIYPNLTYALSDASIFYDRVIIALTNEIIGRVNDYVMSLILGEVKCI